MPGNNSSAISIAVSQRPFEQLRQVHRRSAERLQDLCCSNRGTFIKVGQHLGALDYLLPEGYTSTMKVLHSRAPQSSMEEIRPVIREDLGKELSDLFIQFEKKPQGAASLAQVQKVVLPDGRTVAVKVQHPKVQHKSSKNIVVMEFLLQVVHWLFPDFSFMWLVEETKKNMPLELDFLNEGRNAEKIADMLKQFKFLKIPKIHWDLSTKRILTMDYAEGGQVNDRKYMRRNGININKISWMSHPWKGGKYGKQTVRWLETQSEKKTAAAEIHVNVISWNLGKIYSEMIFVMDSCTVILTLGTCWCRSVLKAIRRKLCYSITVCIRC
uniref:AarF domain-containing protein kinase 1 n=2 Tax=Cyprinus carpio TaxID=7962 RepID=A0A9J8CQV2_CYPCA